MKLTVVLQSAALIALLSLFTGTCEGRLRRGVDDDNSSKQPDPRRDAAAVLQETGDPKVDYDDLAKTFLLKGTKKKEEKKEPRKIAAIDCTLYKMLEDRRAVTEKIRELVKKNKEARKQLKFFNKQLSKIIEENKHGDIPRRSEQNSQWIKPLKSTEDVEKKIKQLKDLHHSNEMKIAVLKTKKFELTESIEMFHLNRIRAAQENNKKQNEEKSFLELGEGCKHLSTS